MDVVLVLFASGKKVSRLEDQRQMTLLNGYTQRLVSCGQYSSLDTVLTFLASVAYSFGPCNS